MHTHKRLNSYQRHRNLPDERSSKYRGKMIGVLREANEFTVSVADLESLFVVGKAQGRQSQRPELN